MRLARPKALHKAPRKAPPKVPPWRWWKRPTVRCTAPRPQGATACRAEWAWVCARSVRGRAVGHHLLLEVAQRLVQVVAAGLRHVAEHAHDPGLMRLGHARKGRSEEHTSELHHLVISYAVFCLKKKNIYQSSRPDASSPSSDM